MKCEYEDVCLDYPNMCSQCEHNKDKDHYFKPRKGIKYHLYRPMWF